MLRSWLALGLLLVSVSGASAWGKEGHMAIAEAAQGALTDVTRAKIAMILDDDDDLEKGALAAVATWADDLRIGLVSGAATFNKNWKNNASWHFVDLPLGSGGYPDLSTLPLDHPMRSFVGEDDVVHAINRAIAVLENPSPTKHFSRAQAVKWLVHLVGDIHQPLHVTSGYYDTTKSLTKPKIIRDPDRADEAGVLDDRGGNGLLFGGAKNNLHAAWDVCMVMQIADQECSDKQDTFEVLAAKLTGLMDGDDAQAATMEGDHHAWAAQWATESLKVVVSTKAYNVRLADGGVAIAHHGERYVAATITSPTKDDYLDKHRPTVELQLTKAAVRLAQLLNAIDWK